MATCGSSQKESSDDCVEISKHSETDQVKCIRNTDKQYTVKVPCEVTEKVPRTVQYTDIEGRQKQVPYIDYRLERSTHKETQKYQVPIATTHTKIIPARENAPKTVYINITTQVPRSYRRTMMQTREIQGPVPCYVNAPETRFWTVTEQVPVQKGMVYMDSVVNTVYDTQVRTRLVPETQIVTKQIPVKNVVTKSVSSCPTGVDSCRGDVMTDSNRNHVDGNGLLIYNKSAFGMADSKNHDQFSFGEYSVARGVDNLGNMVGFRQPGGYKDIASGNLGITHSAVDNCYKLNHYGKTSYGRTGNNSSAPITHGADEASMCA